VKPATRHRFAVFGEGSAAKWIEHEARGLNAGFVVRTRSLRELLADPEPACTSRDGERMPIDRDALRRLAAASRPEDEDVLRLPITIRFSSELSDACFLTDPIAAEVVRRAEGFGAAYPFRDGRMYLPLSLGVDLVSRYGGALQGLFL